MGYRRGRDRGRGRGSELWGWPRRNDLGDLCSLPVRLHQMPHFGEVHGFRFETACEFATQAVYGIQTHVDPLEESGFQRFVLVADLG